MHIGSQVKSGFKVSIHLSIHPSTMSLLLFLLPLSPHPLLRLGGFQLDGLRALLVALETATCSLHGGTNVARRTELDPGPWGQLASKSTALIQPKDEAASSRYLDNQRTHSTVFMKCVAADRKRKEGIYHQRSQSPATCLHSSRASLLNTKLFCLLKIPVLSKTGFYYLVHFNILHLFIFLFYFFIYFTNDGNQHSTY